MSQHATSHLSAYESSYYQKVVDVLREISSGRLSAAAGFAIQTNLFNSLVDNTISTINLDRKYANRARTHATI